MAVLTVQKAVAAGTALILVPASAGGDEWAPTGREMLVVLNGGASPIGVTFTCFKPCDTAGLLHDSVQTVAAGAREYFPSPGPNFVDPATNRYKVAYPDGVTSVTVGVVTG